MWYLYTSLFKGTSYKENITHITRLLNSLNKNCKFDFQFLICTPLELPDNIKKKFVNLGASILKIPDTKFNFITKLNLRGWIYRHTLIPLFLYKKGVKRAMHLDSDMLCINAPKMKELDYVIKKGKIGVTLESIIPQGRILPLIPTGGAWRVTNAKYFVNGGFLVYNPQKTVNFFNSWFKRVMFEGISMNRIDDDQTCLNFYINHFPQDFHILPRAWNDRYYYYPPEIPSQKIYEEAAKNVYKINNAPIASPNVCSSYFLHRKDCYRNIEKYIK